MFAADLMSAVCGRSRQLASLLEAASPWTDSLYRSQLEGGSNKLVEAAEESDDDILKSVGGCSRKSNNPIAKSISDPQSFLEDKPK